MLNVKQIRAKFLGRSSQVKYFIKVSPLVSNGEIINIWQHFTTYNYKSPSYGDMRD